MTLPRRDLARYKLGRDLTKAQLVEQASKMDVGEEIFVRWPKSSVQYRLKRDLPHMAFSVRNDDDGVMITRKHSHGLIDKTQAILALEPGQHILLPWSQPTIANLLKNPRCYIPRHHPDRRFRVTGRNLQGNTLVERTQ